MMSKILLSVIQRNGTGFLTAPIIKDINFRPPSKNNDKDNPLLTYFGMIDLIEKNPENKNETP